jgi:UrcA family protein
MLTQHRTSFGLNSASVKSTSAAVIALFTLALPLTSHAGNIVETRYSVRFDKSMAQNEAGLEKIFGKFEKEAKKVCRVGKPLDENGEIISYDTCMTDTVAQLVKSANLDSINTYFEENFLAE